MGDRIHWKEEILRNRNNLDYLTLCFDYASMRLLTPLPLQEIGRHFAYYIFKFIFMNDTYFNLIPISLKIGRKSALIRVMAWQNCDRLPRNME